MLSLLCSGCMRHLRISGGPRTCKAPSELGGNQEGSPLHLQNSAPERAGTHVQGSIVHVLADDIGLAPGSTMLETTSQAPVQSPEFSESLSKLLPLGTPLTLSRGAALWNTGAKPDHVFVILSGTIKLVRQLARRTCIRGFFGPGSTLGGLDALADSPHLVDALVASDSAKVLAVPGAVYARNLIASEDPWGALAEAAWADTSRVYDKIDVLSSGTVESRLAMLLSRLLRDYGRALDDGAMVVDLPLSRQELADLAATSFETAIRVMTRWGDERFVETTREGFIVRNPSRLANLAGDYPISSKKNGFEHGALPPRHAGQSARRSGRALRFELPKGRVIISRADRLGLFSKEERVYLDADGRFHRAWLGETSYQRGLDGRVRRLTLRKNGKRHLPVIDILEGADAQEAIERAYAVVQKFWAELPSATPRRVRLQLREALSWTPERHADHAKSYSDVYRPIPILPPDQTDAIVVQPSTGCAWNRCSFCKFYAEERFTVRRPDAFRRHVQQVAALHGRTLRHRRRVFLGQANGLCGKADRLERVLQIAREELGNRHGWEFAAFANPARAPRTIKELERLRRRGLKSLTMGLETGHEELHQMLNKPASVDEYVQFAKQVGAASIRRSVVLLVGAGGVKLSAQHVTSTVEAIRQMELGKEDTVYLSPIVVEESSPFAKALDDLGRPTNEQLIAELAALKNGLRAAGVSGSIARYDIERFLY